MLLDDIDDELELVDGDGLDEELLDPHWMYKIDIGPLLLDELLLPDVVHCSDQRRPIIRPDPSYPSRSEQASPPNGFGTPACTAELVWALFIIEQSIPLPSRMSPTRDGPKNCQSATVSE